MEAWEEIKRLVLELEEEDGVWIDKKKRIENLVIRKPRLKLRGEGGRNQEPALVSKEGRTCVMGDSQGGGGTGTGPGTELGNGKEKERDGKKQKEEDGGGRQSQEPVLVSE